ncbi:hypothetical protein ACM66B_004582 [Microbotryomycetes sp. NB124-2]
MSCVCTMIITNHFVLPDPFSVRAVCTPAHPQLRDLVIYTPEAPDSVSVVCYDAVARVDLCARSPTVYTRLRFSPSTIATGCGLIACGGQNAELAIKSADPRSTWCHQITDSTSGAINNSIHIAPAPLSPSTPRLYVSNNDECIKVYDVVGSVPDFRAAKRRRTRTTSRWARAEHDRSREGRQAETDHDSQSDSTSGQVEEQGTYDVGGQCMLERRESATIQFDTAINHCSVSPDGRRLVAVGDTNEIHLYDCLLNGDYAHVHSFQASEDASFSTDWSQTGDKFAVASQDGSVNVFDVRAMPPCDSGHHRNPPRSLAALRSTQRGSAGAVRKIKFSGGNRVESELLAFTEHRSRLHIVDARTFQECQIVEVPRAASSSHFQSPPLRHRPLPTSVGARSAFEQLYSHTGATSSQSPVRRRLVDRVSLDTDYTVEVIDQATDEDALEDGWPNDDDSDPDYWVSRTLEDAPAGRSSSQERRQQLRRAFEEDCPPEISLETSSGNRTSVPWSNYSRILPDPRARTSRLDHRTTLTSSSTSNNSNSSDVRGGSGSFPRNMLPTRSLRTDPVFAATNASNNRNLSGYSPLTSFPANVSDYRDGGRLSYVFESGNTLTSSSSPFGSGSMSNTGYQPNSLYFPIDSTPSDLLGLDWNEEGTSLFVATEDRVWEWQVDTRARRSFGDYGFL